MIQDSGDSSALAYRLVRTIPDDNELRSYADHTIFQTRAWLDFILETQGGKPVVADLFSSDRKIGRFTGVMVRRFGIPILGSPLPGWGSGYQGFNLTSGVSRVKAYRALRSFAFSELGCMHVEVTDRRTSPGELIDAGFLVDDGGWAGYEVDLSPTLDDVFSAMKQSARTAFRKAKRLGVTVEPADDMRFALDYYAQLEDVFAKQSLIPTYRLDRVEALIRHLKPTGNLLLLRALSSDGTCVATGIFPAANGTMYFWGGASWRRHQHLNPNEALHWGAIQYWKERGCNTYDLLGGGRYKEKYGTYPILVAQGRASRFALLEHLRNGRRDLQNTLQKVVGALKK